MVLSKMDKSIDIEKISLSGDMRRKKLKLEMDVEKEIIYRDIIYKDEYRDNIRIELRGVKVLEVNKKKGLIRVVLMCDRGKDIIENIEKKIVNLIGGDFISCLMNVEGKDILNLAKGDKINNCVRGMDIDCEIIIGNIQMVDDKCTCGVILERYSVCGDIMYGEILEDEYYV